MEYRVSPIAKKIVYEKQDFEDLVDFFFERRDICGLLRQRISTNSDARLWIPDSRGWTDATYRQYFEDAPNILLEVAAIYRGAFREEGGRFCIDWYGARSIKDDEYFIVWIKSVEFTAYVSRLRGKRQRHTPREFIVHLLAQPTL